ncbi:MAG TPA: hypothetical protein VF184_04125 [Phycisphaeraceae bacterium]
MATSPSSALLTPQQALLILRIIWAAMLAGEGIFLAVIIGLLSASQFVPNDSLHPLLAYIALGLLAVAVPAGYFARMQTYKANWREHAVAPLGYMRGNIMLLAMLEGAAMFSLVAVLLTGRYVPEAIGAFVAMAVQVVNFPTGKPMRPAPPIFPSIHASQP